MRVFIFANFLFLRKFLIKSNKRKGKEKRTCQFRCCLYVSLHEEYDKTKLNILKIIWIEVYFFFKYYSFFTKILNNESIYFYKSSKLGCFTFYFCQKFVKFFNSYTRKRLPLQKAPSAEAADCTTSLKYNVVSTKINSVESLIESLLMFLRN